MPDPHDLIRTMPAQGVVPLKRPPEKQGGFFYGFTTFF